MASKTAYETKGAIPKPAKFDTELGSSRAGPIRELVPELGTRLLAIQTFQKMARTDVTSKVALKAAKVPILGAEFYIDPMSEDQLNIDAADFVEYNLFRGMSTPWSAVLSKILHFMRDGYSVFEIVPTRAPWRPDRTMANAKNYIMLRKLAYRPALTIKDIELDDAGGPANVIHTKIDKTGKRSDVTIPIENAIVFPFGDADDLFGESILRAAYGNYYYKTHMYKVDAIQKERHGIGIPMGNLPPGHTPEDAKALETLLANLRTNEKAFATLPYGYEVYFAELKGQLVNVLESATHHDVLILMNVLAQFLMLGTNDQSGSRAVSGAQLDIFYKSEWFVAQTVCDYLNMFLIPKLVLWNFEVDTIPQMKVRNIGQARELQQLAAGLSNLVSQNIITNDIETENWTRRIFDMPMKRGGQTPKQAPPVVDPNAPQNQNQNQNGKGKGTTDINPGKGSGRTNKSPTEA